MKRLRAHFVLLPLVAISAALTAQDGAVVGKTVYHTDGSRTESVSDPGTRQMEQKTYDGNDVLILRRHYQLNENGQPVMGNLYDGSGNLVARSQSVLDGFGRLQEERLSNLQGEVYQQIIHEYDSEGKPKKPKVINYKVSSPTMRPAVLDFTNSQPGTTTSATGAGVGRVQAPVNLDQTTSQPQQPSAAPAPPPEEPKKGFLQRLFKRK